MKASRAKYKIDGQAVKGQEGDTECIHLNIRPLNAAINTAYYPATIPVMVKGNTIEVGYEIKPHPLLEGRICLKTCHQYKYGHAVHLKETGYGAAVDAYCRCDDHQGPARPNKREGAAALDKAVQEAMATGKAKKDEPYPFADGLCRFATSKRIKLCAYKHEEAFEAGLRHQLPRATARH